MKEWQSQRQTKYLKALLEEEIEEIKNEWAVGGFSHESVEKTAQLSAEGIGRIIGLFYALDLLDREDFADEEEEIE